MWTQLGPKEVTVPSVSSNSGVSTDWAGALTRPLLGDGFGKPFLQSWRQKWCFHLEAQSLRHWDQSCTVYGVAHCSPSRTSSDHPVLCTLLAPRFQGDFLLSPFSPSKLPELSWLLSSFRCCLVCPATLTAFCYFEEDFQKYFLFSVFSWF